MTVLRSTDPPPSLAVSGRSSRPPAPIKNAHSAQRLGYDSRADVPDDSDESLMLRYQQGDEAAFRQLFARYGAAIYRYFFHRTGRDDVASDCAQSTWLNLHRARASYRPGERLRPWLYAIAANLRIDQVRSRLRSREQLTADGALPDWPTPSSMTATADRDGAVRRALLSLPDDARHVIILHRWHDLGFAEIAAILGQGESAVKVRAHRVYLQLRKLLTDGGEEP